jgi:hypothetical protein
MTRETDAYTICKLVEEPLPEPEEVEEAGWGEDDED